MDKRLDSVTIKGFRSLRDVTVELSPINVLIGPNGAGKSNFLAFLKMMSLLRTRSLRAYVATSGGAATMLHYGPKATPVMEFRLEFLQGHHKNAYHAQLGFAANDSLVFLDESAGVLNANQHEWREFSLGSGHTESLIENAARDPSKPATRAVNWWLSRINFFHFHDTSINSTLRTNASTTRYQYLHSDGSNLAAYLLWLSQAADRNATVAWTRINMLVREVAPFIKQLKPTPVSALDPESFDITTAEPTSVRLDWVDQKDVVFGPHQLSDGTLRAIALITALAQPSATLPAVISIDEPELGLHPAALGVLASLIRSSSTRSQIILATQSPTFLDHFDPEEVLVTENISGETQIRRLDPEHLSKWTEEYKLSELFDMNILGGRP
ncbi:MAG: AAA family ATPase [Enhygromyxa sp.]